ncbi:histidine phosphatase family protein [Streptomyces sp. TRM66268-LWL]|uniref:Histidine phosphatase family protein n=1 Tax=Streptomyces polyasparticus TaxID=2767826 RepID=A0ABR7SGX7_9ACTN|nr:histidine phosphatase family protein [Streptomyces polyasparticus]MBC9714469.1 histidine phosphatase family protein [Streptomyces polyasparticus]
MTTYILRHGETHSSPQYLVNGDPTRPIPLSKEGLASCGLAWHLLPLRQVSTWLCSEFPRAHQTASRLMGVPEPDPVIVPQLNELDYGDFEGGPFLEYAAWLTEHGGWRRPPRARESQREGIRRMLTGLRATVEHPSPRVIVCHGLLVSVLLWHRERSADEPMPLFFPEAPYVQPLTFTDEELLSCAKHLLADLDAEQDDGARSHTALGKPRKDHEAEVATFDRVNHPHAQRELPDA